MTRAEILAAWPTLSPRERDRLVAHAAGWRFLFHEKRPAGASPSCTFGCPPGAEPPADGIFDQVPHFDEWANVGPLLEELAQLTLWVELNAPENAVDGWAVEVFDEEGEPFLDCPRGETAPSAIALAYVLVKTEDE